jgi:hypothetical protein
MLSVLISVLWRVKWLTLTRLRSFCHVKVKFHSPASNLFTVQRTNFSSYILHVGSMRQINVGLCLCVQKVILIYVSGSKVKVKVKQSHCRPGQALRFPGGRVSQIYRQSAHEGGKVVSPTSGHSATERIISMKNSNDTIGNRTRDLPVFSAMSQSTAPSR